MVHSITISKDACQGCVNCIRVCPTEAIRVVDGQISIISELCVDCGECLRSCNRKALGMYEDDWNRIKESSRSVVVADPVFFTQFSHYAQPEDLEEVLAHLGINVLVDEAADAFDLSAYATARIIERSSRESLPVISVYCPAVLRLIQLKFPELLSRITPVLTPLEMMADIWRARTNSDVPITLLTPCPAKATMVRDPQGRKSTSLNYSVSIRRVARTIMAEGNIELDPGRKPPKKRNNRWVQWARRAGESKHVQAFTKKKLTILAVSGMRNTLDVLQELELGRLRGVDFVECRVCDTGCVGGIANADSRFLASLRVNGINTDWDINEKDMERAEELHAMGLWPMPEELEPRPRMPLSDNVADAMMKLQQMKEIYGGLPHIDCGSCGRPSCRAMAEEIVRGNGSATDCIFKLREGIASLAKEIVTLSESQLHTLKRKDD